LSAVFTFITKTGFRVSMTPYEPLDVDRIEAARRGAVIGRKIVVFKSTGSTNDIAWEYAGKIDNHGLCVLAESQTKGRGRRGRTWYSKPGESILCSILLTKLSIEAEGLTLAAAVATAEAVREMCGVHCRIKWPNDLLAGDRKLAGILVEKRTVRGADRFVTGIGINCRQEAADFDQAKLNLPATSLTVETGKSIDRTDLVCRLLDNMELWLGRPAETIIERWLELSGMLGRRVSVECDGSRFSGTCRGVDPVHGLIVQPDRGAIRFFPAGQTSLIG
jgi:BirA family biotin operon repressor/biotin-[acetyl-CoA-carboxylase] ligase